MDYAVLGYFDSETEQILQQWTRQLVDAGVNSHYLNTGMRPHLTLAEIDVARFDPVKDQVNQLALKLQPISLRLASAGFFPQSNGVLFLAPIVAEDLLEFHRQVNSALEPLSDAFSPLYREENWVPHCTLALEMETGELEAAYSLLRQVFRPLDTRLEAISIIACCPYREKLVSRLGRGPA